MQVPRRSGWWWMATDSDSWGNCRYLDGARNEVRGSWQLGLDGGGWATGGIPVGLAMAE